MNTPEDEADYGKPSRGGRQPLTEGWKPEKDDESDKDE